MGEIVHARCPRGCAEQTISPTPNAAARRIQTTPTALPCGNINGTTIEFVEGLNAQGASPFKTWFDNLDSQAAAIVTVAIERLADGNLSRVKSIGEGAAEIRIDRGPGYRIYFGWDGKTLVVLLGGGTKRRQQCDIADALALWRAYKARKATLGRG